MKSETRVGKAEESFPRGIGVADRIIDGRVGGRGDNSENDALIFRRRRLVRRVLVEQNREERQANPNCVNGRACGEGAIEMAAVPVSEAIEGAINKRAESLVSVPRAQEVGRHHRRKGECDDARNRDCPRERERELAKKRAGQASLHGDGGVDRRQRQRHRDNRTDELARPANGGVEARHALAQMTLDIFHDDDGVIDDQPDGKNDREKSEQVDRESEDLHEKKRPDQRDGNRHNRDEDGAKRAEK